MLNAERRFRSTPWVRVFTCLNHSNELAAPGVVRYFFARSHNAKTDETWMFAVSGGSDSSALVTVTPRDARPFVNSFRLGDD